MLMVNKMANVTDKNGKFKEYYEFEYSSLSKMIIDSRIFKRIRRYFSKEHNYDNDDKNPMIYNHLVSISPQETWTRDTVRMSIR